MNQRDDEKRYSFLHNQSNMGSKPTRWPVSFIFTFLAFGMLSVTPTRRLSTHAIPRSTATIPWDQNWPRCLFKQHRTSGYYTARSFAKPVMPQSIISRIVSYPQWRPLSKRWNSENPLLQRAVLSEEEISSNRSSCIRTSQGDTEEQTKEEKRQNGSEEMLNLLNIEDTKELLSHRWARDSIENINRTLELLANPSPPFSTATTLLNMKEEATESSRKTHSIPSTSSTSTSSSPSSTSPSHSHQQEGQQQHIATTELLRFALSTVGIYWASPLMSLIDTSAVGSCAGKLSLAALGPASTLSDYAYYVNTWIGTAMTNLQAHAFAEKDSSASRKTVVTGLKLALTAGLVFSISLWAFAPMMILGYSSGVGPEILPFSVEYMRIRAFGFPAALVTMVAQAALLASRNTKIPLLAVAVEAALNFVGDFYMVRVLGMGIGGAAWATVISQYAGMALILPMLRNALRNQKQQWGKIIQKEEEEKEDKRREHRRWGSILQRISSSLSQHKLARNGTAVVEGSSSSTSSSISGSSSSSSSNSSSSSSGGNSNDNSSCSSTRAGRSLSEVSSSLSSSPPSPSSSASSPSLSSSSSSPPPSLSSSSSSSSSSSPSSPLKKFLGFTLPVGTTLVGKLVLYLTLTHVATTFGVTALAAHQVMLSLFFALTPFCDAVGSTAQTFLPALKKFGTRAQAALMRRLTIMGAIAGASVSCAAGAVSLGFPQLFTSDPALIVIMESIAPLAMAALLGHGALLAGEGWMLASENPLDRKFLGNTYFLMMCIVPLIMTGVASAGGGVTDLWKVFTAMQLSRLLIIRTRLFIRMREVEIEKENGGHLGHYDKHLSRTTTSRGNEETLGLQPA